MGRKIAQQSVRAKSCLQKTTEDYIRQAKGVHGEKYDYFKVNYVRNQDKVTIMCNQHGPFRQTALSHLRGHGCPECGDLARGTPGLYCTSYFSSAPKNLRGYFYVVRMFDNNERFIKIGITKQSDIRKRFGSQVTYRYEVVKYQPMMLDEAYSKEQNIKQSFEHLKYSPKKKFIGHTECFNESVLEHT